MLCAKFFTRKSGSAQNLSFSGHEMNLGPHFVVLLGWLLLELDVGHGDVGIADGPGVIVVLLFEELEGAVAEAVAGEFAAVAGPIYIIHVDLHRYINMAIRFQKVDSLSVSLYGRKAIRNRNRIILPLVSGHAGQADFQAIDWVAVLIGNGTLHGIMSVRDAASRMPIFVF